MWIEYIHVIYIRNTENLVLLLNNTAVKIDLKHENFGWQVHMCIFLENFPEKLVIMYATDRDDMHCCFTFKCIVSSPPYMENGSLGSIRMDTRAQRGATPMFGSLGMCRSHSFLCPLLLSSAWYRFMESSNLKKLFNFTI